MIVVRNNPTLQFPNFDTFLRGIANRIESVNKLELKKAKTVGQLENVMVKLHKHLTFVQSVFDRICR